MITNFFIPELNNHDVQELWFQQDGATCPTIDLLKDTFGDRLISRFEPVNWPPRSCDLTPLDYFCGAIFVELSQNEIAVVPDFHTRILFSDEAHFWLNGYVNKQNCRIWSEANTQVYVETPLHPEKLTVWCALWAGGVLLQKR
ncbi:DUF4817 domain-containing protein [Trichonephila clavipes]|nr:DUF4817 domain-containing protein [Trichonephila clavipes]